MFDAEAPLTPVDRAAYEAKLAKLIEEPKAEVEIAEPSPTTKAFYEKNRRHDV